MKRAFVITGNWAGSVCRAKGAFQLTYAREKLRKVITQEDRDMALVLGLRVGDTVNVGGRWIRLMAVEGRHVVRIRSSDKVTIRLNDKYETEVFPRIWMGLEPLPTSDGIKITFDAPATVKISRGRKSE